MSGFFGIFRPQGGPVDLEAFEQMKTAMHREGFDGMETHVEEKIAMGHLMLRVSPESKYDKQPLKSSCGNYLLVGHFRLDYRDELGDKLGLTQSELEVTPDSQLAMLAYQKWREKCVHHLEGDWAMVVYDTKLESLFLSKDNFGYSALYYCTYGDSILFSSDGNLFKLLTGFKFEINFIQLYRLSLNGFGLRDGYTLEKKIFHVKNNHIVVFKRNFKCDKYAYRTYISNQKILYKHHDDYFADFLNIFSRAVLVRSKSLYSSGIFLSSGLDSSAIAVFLNLQNNKIGQQFSSFTSFPCYSSMLKDIDIERIDETILLNKLLPSLMAIKPSFFNFENSSMIDLFESTKTSDVFNPIVNYNSFWIKGILGEASKKGIRQMYVGQFGNFTLSWDAPLIYFHNLINFKLKSTISYVINLSRQLTFLEVLHKLKYDFYFPLLIQLSYFKSLVTQFYWNNILRGSIFINTIKSDKILEDILLKSLKSETKRVFFNSNQMKEYYFKNNGKHLGMKWFNDGHKMGLQIVDPTVDFRFVKFCFSIPEFLFQKNGIKNYIYIKSLSGLIPDIFLRSRKRGLQSADIFYRIKSDRKFFNYEIAVSNWYNSSGISLNIDFEKLKKNRESPPKNTTDGMLSSNNLLKIYSLLEFLKKNK